MSRNFSTEMFYGFKVQVSMSGASVHEGEWIAPEGLEVIASRRGDHYVYLLSTMKDLSAGSYGANVVALSAAMHDRDIIRQYDAMILKALETLGFESIPAPTSWFVVSDIY